MSRAIEAAALFAVGVVAGGVLVYSTRKALPSSTPPLVASAPTLQKDVIAAGETVPEGSSSLGLRLMTELRRLLPYGFPGPVFDLRKHIAFASSYDRRMRNPAWVSQKGFILM